MQPILIYDNGVITRTEICGIRTWFLFLETVGHRLIPRLVVCDFPHHPESVSEVCIWPLREKVIKALLIKRAYKKAVCCRKRAQIEI